jgi:hypothetical protein
MPDFGSTYRCNLPPRHIWVIISDPNQHGNKFVFVNLTTLTDKCIDDACILQPPDYPPFLTQPTTVAYSRHMIGDTEGMDQLIASGHFGEMPPIPTETLQKILDGARKTKELPKAAKDMLQPA